MKKKYLLLLIVLLLNGFINIYAQNNNLICDSVIMYNLMSKDTNTQFPYLKIVNKFNNNNKISQSEKFYFDKKAKEWVLQLMCKIDYNEKEMIIDIFNIENKKQEILSNRIILKIDKNNKIIGSELFEKDRYTNHFDRLNRYEYMYKNDTLIKKIFYKKSTTFYKEQEDEYTFSKYKMIVIHKEFDEIKGSMKENKNTYLFNEKDLVAYVSNKSNKSIIDSFRYQNDTLIKINHYANFDLKDTTLKLDNFFNTSFYYYKNYLIETRIYKNRKGIEEINYQNTLIKYFVKNDLSTETANLQEPSIYKYIMGSLK